MLRPHTFSLTLFLAFLTALGPIATDMYLPSLPAITRQFATTPSHVQLTLSVYLIGLAIGQIFYGPISDRHGRRPVMVVALLIFCAASLACALSASVEMLIAARFAQAIGGSGSLVLARAVVRDLYSGTRAGRELSLMGMIMAIAPAVGPFAGGIFHAAFGWESNFLVALAAGLVCLFISWRRLPETLQIRAEPLSLAGMLRAYRSIWQDASFRAHLGIISCVYAGLFAWISGSPFALQNFYQLSPFGYGTMYAFSSIGFMAGTAVATHYVTRFGLDRIIGIGTAGTALGGLAMIAAVGVDMWPVEMLTVAAAIFLAGLGLSLPQAMAGALTPFPKRAGAASSLIGFIQQSCAALAGGIVGLLIGASAWPLAISVALMGCLALAIWAATRDARRSMPHP